MQKINKFFTVFAAWHLCVHTIIQVNNLKMCRPYLNIA